MSTPTSPVRGADGARQGCAVALAGLPGMGPRRLAALLDAWDPIEAWARAGSGRSAELEADARMATLLGASGAERAALVASWAEVAARVDVASLVERHAAAGIRVIARGDPAYPDVLAADLEPPAVLFARGRLDALEGSRVAVVGTRRCTGVGAGFARELGRELAEAGVVVVSGLALGIDGAAHRGVLDVAGAPPVGVVGSGLDVVYPARHRDLWVAVGDRGLLLSEVPLGVRPTAWRFPARNRVIAGLADVVVVVESHVQGGSLHTVEEAQRRGHPVLAVPGSVRSPAAGGTNALIADGCHPVCDVDDVLVALGLTSGPPRTRRDDRPAPDDTGRAVLDAFDWEPATLEHLAVRTALPLPELTRSLEALLGSGWVALDGGWYERVSGP